MRASVLSARGALDGSGAGGPHRPARAARLRARGRVSGRRRRPADVGVALVVQPQTRDEWRSFMQLALAAAEGWHRDPARDDCVDGEVVGSTRFLALRPEHGSVEIGWTWLHPLGLEHRARTSRRSSSSSATRSTPGAAGRRAQDRRAERAHARRARGARRDLRGRPPQAHARPWRREPRQRVVQRHGRGLAGRARAARGADLRRVDAPLYPHGARYPATELEHEDDRSITSLARAAASARR